MPLDPQTVATVTDGINQVASTISTNDINRRTQRFAREQYDKQRKDNLADWEMQNAYNSPEAQMRRLKEAGLNPNLVYGNGADATSSAPPRSAETGSWNPKAPEFDMNFGANHLAAYYDTQVKQAQIDNLKVQNTIGTQQALHEAVKIQETVQRTEGLSTSTAESKVRLKYADELAKISLNAAQVGVDKTNADIIKTQADTKFTTDSNKRANQQQPLLLSKLAADVANTKMSTAKTQEEITNTKAQLNNLLREGILKDLEINVRERGGNPNDAYWEKKLQQTIEYLLNGGKDWLQYFRMLTNENPQRK